MENFLRLKTKQGHILLTGTPCQIVSYSSQELLLTACFIVAVVCRDGKLFEPILSFLRTNHLKVILKHSFLSVLKNNHMILFFFFHDQIPEGHNLEAILNEMEFYGMTELSEHISSR